jgi:phosphoribosyl-AMP cyclohydrolase
MELKFDDRGLIPAIIQDAESGEVLMLGYMNEESLARTLESGRTWFWSRSRQEFWCKGETSGNRQYVREIRYDCDHDALVVKVLQVGPACHTGERSCFYRVLDGARTDLEPGE